VDRHLSLVILLIIAVSLGWGLFTLARRGGRAMAGYTVLLGANLLLTVMLIATGTFGGPLFYFAIACFVLLVIVPSVLRGAIRRAMAKDRFDLALRLSRVRELLQPGAGGSRERVMLSAVALARQGRTEAAIDSLETWAQRGGPERLLEAQEQIVALLAMEQRFEDAIAYGSALGDAPTRRPLLAAGLVRAYAEVGDLRRSAEMLRRVEEGPAGSDLAAANLLNQARLFFLAHVGEADALAYLLSRDSGFLPSLPAKTRAYWRGVALMRAGRTDAGRAELLRAQAVAGVDEDRLRASIRKRIAEGAGEPAPEDVVRFAREVAVRARVHRALPTSGRVVRVAPMTIGFATAIVLIFALVEIGAGSSTDPWTLIRAGAHFRPAVRAGDLWRTVSATFLHGGLLHLVLNTYALYVFGRFVEQLYGSARFFVLYVAAGAIGFVASFYYGKAALSVGASGCIFGLLGAAIAILLVRRGRWPEAWRRGTLMTFAFLAAINIYIGFSLPMIDNAAHLGGLGTGLVFGMLLVPGGILGSGRAGRAVVALLATASTLAIGYGSVGTLSSDPERLLTRLPSVESRLGSVVLRHPAYWSVERDEVTAALVDPAGALGLVVGDVDPREAEREIQGERVVDAGSELACRRLAAGPTFCLRYSRTGRAAYLPALDVLAKTARPAEP